MNESVNTGTKPRTLTTADLAAAAPPVPRELDGDGDEAERMRRNSPRTEEGGPCERLDALFAADAASAFRSEWADIQISFVDDPRQAVREGDELVAQVMKSLAESFSSERARLEAQLSDGGDASTELLRVALRRYRSFFERLLAL